eukprot:4050040-Prymnesium_polylepis.2
MAGLHRLLAATAPSASRRRGRAAEEAPLVARGAHDHRRPTRSHPRHARPRRRGRRRPPGRPS